MIILLYILFVFAIVSNIVSSVSYIKSANRKANYTMIEIKALRQVRDQIEKLSKKGKWEERMIILLCILVIIALCLCLTFTETVWYDKKHGMKYTLTDSSFTAEWDYSSPLTMLKLTKLFIQGEFDTEKRNKYIKEYNRLKKSLENDGYDTSDFPSYEK